jgi:hypothetical protein
LLAILAIFTPVNAAVRGAQQQAQDSLGVTRRALAFVETDATRPELAAELRQLEERYAAWEAEAQADWKALEEKAKQLQRKIILSHPLLGFDDLLFVERDVLVTAPGYKPTTEQGPFYDGAQSMDQCFGHNAQKGGGLYVLKKWRSGSARRVDLVAGLRVPGGTNSGRLLSEGAFMSPALSYDGKTVVFAWASGGHEKWKQENRFNLFRVNIDGSGLARLTDGDYDDFDPCWLPDGKIVFISTRRGGFGRCHPRPVPIYTLHSMNADGSGIRCLSFHETNEWQPSVGHDGMILYTRWDYVDRDAMIAIHPWTCFPDGRDPRAVQGNYPLPWTSMTGSNWPDGRKLRPLCEHGVRAIPNSRKYIAVATPHHNESYGSLVLVDPNAEDDGQMSPLKRLTPEVRFPENEGGEMAYGTPWPLREDLYLCNYRDSLGVLYFVDGKGVLVPVYRGERLRPISPIPLRATVLPPVIPPQVSQVASSNESSRATIYVQNVYDTDNFGRLPQGVKICAMRIVQVFPKTTPVEDQPRVSKFSESLVRASLGTVPVEADGSVYCEVPAGKEIYFQLLDERGVAVQSMRSGTYLHAGERLACVGCHEGRRQTPRLSSSPLATRREPSPITPELKGMAGLEPVETVNFYRLAKPVLDARCAGCHQRERKGPSMSYASLGKYLSGFEGKWDMLNKARVGGSRTLPGQCGALAASLYADGYLSGQSTRCPGKVKLSDEELHRITLWLDLNSNELGAYHDVDAQKRGKLVQPEID